MTVLTQTPTTETAAPSQTGLRVAYVMQNVGVDLAAEVGQMMLIRQTIQGLEQQGHTYAGLLSVGVAYASQKPGTPYVLTVDADLLLEADVMGDPITGLRHKAAQWAANTSYYLADQIITVSDPTKKNLVENWGMSAEKIKVIPNGVNVEHFQQPVDTKQVRAELGLDETPSIMFVGGFQRWHGLDKLLEALACLHLLQNEAERVRLGVNAQREAEHAWGRQIERLEQMHEAALGRR